jgi:hypothetical protein
MLSDVPFLAIVFASFRLLSSLLGSFTGEIEEKLEEGERVIQSIQT